MLFASGAKVQKDCLHLWDQRFRHRDTEAVNQMTNTRNWLMGLRWKAAIIIQISVLFVCMEK